MRGRYVGGAKTLFQLATAAAVANLTLLAAAVALLSVLLIALAALTARPAPTTGGGRPYAFEPVRGRPRSADTAAFRPGV